MFTTVHLSRPVSTNATSRERLALTALAIVLGLTVANLAFNLIAAALGHGFPYTSFLFRPDDNFGDFFSYLRGYPDGALARVADRNGLHAILPTAPPSSRDIDAGIIPDVTNMHMMPLSTTLGLVILAPMRWIDPVVLFLSIMAALAAGWGLTVHRFAVTRREAAAWFVLGALCYPTLMMVARGNVFAGLTSLLLINALICSVRREAWLAAAVMLAIAVNIRPNAILLGLPMLILYGPHRGRFFVATGVAGCVLAGASLLAATTLYPAYSLSAMREGLGRYYNLYAVGNWGLIYGSSLFGLFKLQFGYRAGLDAIAGLISLGILGGGMIALAFRRIDASTAIFLVIAGYCLGSTVLADYHLAIFLIVPMIIASAPVREPGSFPATTHRIALVASVLVLAPKNYLFDGEVSLQVMLNPAILTGAAIAIIAMATTAGRSRIVAEPSLPTSFR